MKTIRKIHAFTLSEMLVVLVISSIVISLAFVTLTLVQKQVSVIKNNFNERQEIQFLERILWHDFNSYSVEYHKQSDTFFLKNSIDSIQYVLNDTFVVRNNDTLAVSIKNKQLFLDGSQVQDGIIDAIRLETNTNFRNNLVFVYKFKDASNYLNNN